MSLLCRTSLDSGRIGIQHPNPMRLTGEFLFKG